MCGAVRVPVFVVEDHDEALHYVYRAIGSKKIPFENGTLVHFDSHPDLMIPQKFDSSKIFDKEYVLRAISIESWIMPAVYAKHFSSIAWVKPPWSLQLPDGTHKFKVGHHRSTKEIKLTCCEPYFVSELAWSPACDLECTSDVMLEVCTLHGEVPVGKSASDVSEPTSCSCLHTKLASCHVLSPEFCAHLQQRSYVLDIDLDFFSTRNPFLSLFTPEQFQMLSELYHYEHPSEPIDEHALHEATEKRYRQISELESQLKCVNKTVNLEDVCRNPKLLSFLKTFEGNSSYPDAELIHSAGCTCDDCALPHHVSTPEEVCQLVEAVRKTLYGLPEPGLITVARSSYDDYCPPEDVDFIQDKVINMIKSLYGHVDIHLNYNSKCNSSQ